MGEQWSDRENLLDKGARAKRCFILDLSTVKDNQSSGSFFVEDSVATFTASDGILKTRSSRKHQEEVALPLAWLPDWSDIHRKCIPSFVDLHQGSAPGLAWTRLASTFWDSFVKNWFEIVNQSNINYIERVEKNSERRQKILLIWKDSLANRK